MNESALKQISFFFAEKKTRKALIRKKIRGIQVTSGQKVSAGLTLKIYLCKKISTVATYENLEKNI